MFRNFILCLVVFLPVITVSGKSNSPYPARALDIITITVNASGNATVNGITCPYDSIHVAVEKRLWKKYLTTGRMQDRIKLRFTGEVLMGVRGSALDEVLLAQQNTLKKLCLRKYGQEFEMLSDTRKSYIKRKFPVLFQELHW